MGIDKINKRLHDAYGDRCGRRIKGITLWLPDA